MVMPRRGVDKPCRVCRTTFYAPAHRPTAKFCSPRCAADGMRESRAAALAARRKNHGSCVVCGKYPLRWGITTKFCSIACRKRHTAERVERRCSRCREMKPIADFVRGNSSHCKPCNSAWFHERSGKAPEQRKTYRPAYKLTDEERRRSILEASRRNHLRRRAAGRPPTTAEIHCIGDGQEWRCAYCACELGPYHIDHKLPVSRGGTNDTENLQLTCPRCNLRKSDMTHEEFLASKRRPVVEWAQ